MKLETVKTTAIFNPLWIILLLSGLNLWIMHYCILLNCHMDAILDMTAFLDNYCTVCFDVIVIFVVFLLITKGNMKIAIGFCFIITWIWSFSNLIYSRSFFHYLSLSAIGQGGSIFDNVVFRCIISNIRLTDSLYLILFFLFLYNIRRPIPNNRLYLKNTLYFTCLILMVDFIGHALFCICSPQRRYVDYFMHRMNVTHFSNQIYSSQPIYANFVRGSLRSILSEIMLEMQGKMEISDEQMGIIEQHVASTRRGHVTNFDIIRPENVIFILVESYMSFTSGMKVGNREVTPCLNALRNDSSVYYNGEMKENVTIGESSDGQFIYMTGLLPLRSIVTVSKARKVSLPGLPKMLGKESRMVIPTVASMWNQDEMCWQYGFDKLYTSNDYEGGRHGSLTDEQVFNLAMQKDRDSRRPFFSVILTLSMHQPYTNQIDSTFPIAEKSMSKELACYLNACHYTDHQIGLYINHLKRTGLYDNSLIIIAADHPVHNNIFGNVSDDIPLYIINSSVSPKNMWQGECNQVDVYTTLLDLLGCKSDWYGLGHSLIPPDYKNSVSDRTWDVSEWIIMGDYFSKR